MHLHLAIIGHIGQYIQPIYTLSDSCVVASVLAGAGGSVCVPAGGEIQGLVYLSCCCQTAGKQERDSGGI